MGLTPEQVERYLGGFNYRFGEAEAEAIERFRAMYKEVVDDDADRP